MADRKLEVSDIEIYDRAVADRLTSILPRVVYAPTDKALYTISKNAKFKDKTPYPFISFYRDANMPIVEGMDGFRSHHVGDLTRTVRKGDSTECHIVNAEYVHSIPVNLVYQVDVWGVKATEVLVYAQNLMVDLSMKLPVLMVPINPDGENGRFDILDVEWVDNSDIESETENGRLYRHTINFRIEAFIKYIRDMITTDCLDISVELY